MRNFVVVTTRLVYHKIAEVSVQVPDEIKNEDVASWLIDNEHLWEDEMQENIDFADAEFGFGFIDGLNDEMASSETRYDIYTDDGIIGGHI